MPILLNTAISALDTPSSLLPFFVKDSFDNTGRTIMAYSEGGKHEARERFIEETGTSLFWIGGIPAVRALANKIFKHKIDTDIHFKRINTDGVQSYFADEIVETIKENGKEITKKKFSKEDLQGIVLNGKKLGEIQEKLFKAGYIPNAAKGKYKTYHKGVSIAAVLINFFMLTVAVPMFNQFLSRKIISKEVNEKKQNYDKKPADKFLLNPDNINFTHNSKKNNAGNIKSPSFGSLASLKDFFKVKDLLNFEKMAEEAQLNATSSMLILDYGISGSRVTFIPRDNNERVEYAVKEGGIILFFYYAADLIKNGLSNIANKVFNTPIDLDYKIIASKEFLNELKNSKNKEELLQFVQIAENDNKAELKVIKFIDAELAKITKETPKEAVFKNFTLKMAQKQGLIDVEYDDAMGRWIRHSKKYIETEKLTKLNGNLKTFYEKAFEKGKSIGTLSNIDSIISKTQKVKIASVIGNIIICCASLAFLLPKIQYMIREHRTQTKSAPGIKLYQDLAQNNQLKV